MWTSPIIWKLKSNNTEINPLAEPIATFQVSMLLGSLSLGGIIGPTFFIYLLDAIGRRKTMIILSTIMIVFEAVLAFSTNIDIYCAARVILGFCVGAGPAVTSIYLSELAQDHNRGMIGCFIGLTFPLGNLYVYLIGPIFSVKIFTLLCTIPNIVNIICLILFIPESPLYLASKGCREDTIKALQKIRNNNSREIENEYKTIVQTLNSSNKKEPSWKSLFVEKSLRKGFIIAVGLNSCQQLSGISAILAYAGPLFDAVGASLSGDMTAILIGIVKLCTTILATVIIETVGRRYLLLLSTMSTGTPLFLLGVYFYFKNTNFINLDDILWLPLVSILLYIIAYSFGLGIIPVAMMSELIPINYKSKVSSVCSVIVLLLSLLVTTSFPIINDFIGPSWCFWLFSIFQLVSFLFIYFLVPEIKGKSFLEVQKLLSK